VELQVIVEVPPLATVVGDAAKVTAGATAATAWESTGLAAVAVLAVVPVLAVTGVPVLAVAVTGDAVLVLAATGLSVLLVPLALAV
jgi:hypothetical protein